VFLQLRAELGWNVEFFFNWGGSFDVGDFGKLRKFIRFWFWLIVNSVLSNHMRRWLLGMSIDHLRFEMKRRPLLFLVSAMVQKVKHLLQYNYNSLIKSKTSRNRFHAFGFFIVIYIQLTFLNSEYFTLLESWLQSKSHWIGNLH
jgi:hypothetical protein